mmetsp:Transcript_78286/g.209271  ORF Transcript_78286/g.209271 Transcript_78286/m.209271 type:complete len:223 (+) Transcript_78286:46-714(+)
MGVVIQCSIAVLLVSFLIFSLWVTVPTDQTFENMFPNVIFMHGWGNMAIEPVAADNSTLPELPAEKMSALNGLYGHEMMFYHKTMDRFIPWEDRSKYRVWSCSVLCSPPSGTPGSSVALVLYSQNPKRHVWYVVELNDEDANSPVVYGRTKFRKNPHYDVPWVTHTPGDAVKPKNMDGVFITISWSLFKMDTPEKWTTAACLLLGTVASAWACRRSMFDDDD